MGKIMIINKKYQVKRGILKGFEGILVAYDAETSEARIKIDKFSSLEISSEFLELINS